MKYTVQAASKATGVSSARLRTWERRYGVPPPGPLRNRAAASTRTRTSP